MKTMDPRNGLVLAAAITGLGGCSDRTEPDATLSAWAVAASNGQTGVIGRPLPLPLQVQVGTEGGPKEGVRVVWAASAGTVQPSSSRTDATGVAGTVWTLGLVPGLMTASATVTGAIGSPVGFNAAGLEAPTVRALGASDGQTAEAGTALPVPLQVLVEFAGAPRPGVTVAWLTSHGRVSPGSSVTDAAGVATTTWTLGHIAGVGTASASVAGASPARFEATALPGPAAGIERIHGDGQTLAVNGKQFAPLRVKVTDRYGNGVEGQAITWSVEYGPVVLQTTGDTSNVDGSASAVAAPSGAEGSALVQASLPGNATSVSFALTVGPHELAVTLITDGDHYAFVSDQNGSTPATDTVSVGATMKWALSRFDYELHTVTSVALPAFPAVTFPNASPSTVSVTFTQAGTYRYVDGHHPEASGTIVVR